MYLANLIKNEFLDIPAQDLVFGSGSERFQEPGADPSDLSCFLGVVDIAVDEDNAA